MHRFSELKENGETARDANDVGKRGHLAATSPAQRRGRYGLRRRQPQEQLLPLSATKSATVREFCAIIAQENLLLYKILLVCYFASVTRLSAGEMCYDCLHYGDNLYFKEKNTAMLSTFAPPSVATATGAKPPICGGASIGRAVERFCIEIFGGKRSFCHVNTILWTLHPVSHVAIPEGTLDGEDDGFLGAVLLNTARFPR